jgi:hypothetical protein
MLRSHHLCLCSSIHKKTSAVRSCKVSGEVYAGGCLDVDTQYSMGSSPEFLCLTVLVVCMLQCKHK